MMYYQKEMIKALNLDALNIPEVFGPGILDICCTSVDDAKHSIRICDDISILWACITYESKIDGRVSLLKMLKAKINKLKRQA